MTTDQSSFGASDLTKLRAIDGLIRDIRNLDKSIDVKALEDYSYNLECKIWSDFSPKYDVHTYYAAPSSAKASGQMVARHKDGRKTAISYGYDISPEGRHIEVIQAWAAEHEQGCTPRLVEGSPFNGRAWKCSK